MSTFKRALISVSDKTDLEKVVKSLVENGVDILSTGGTAAAIRSLGYSVTNVSDVTKFPEILDGRVKTLHPVIHGGILADRSNDEHTDTLKKMNIDPIDIVIVNLYPFLNTLRKYPDDTEEIVENIDIGGPCMIRASAKNFKNCLTITDPADYDLLIGLLKNDRNISIETRKKLAFKAFNHTCQYDYHIQAWLSDGDQSQLPDNILCLLEKDENLRYGENPHQDAAVYRIPNKSDTGLLGYTQLGGKALSFNNILDLNAAWEIATQFETPASIVVKHQNPCGAALADSLDQAYENALAGDPMSAFGGIVALNKPVDLVTAQKLHKTKFLEVIAAPEFDTDSLELLKKKKNRRLIQLTEVTPEEDRLDIRLFHNGALIQSRDRSNESREAFRVVTERQPTEEQWEDLLFGWKICHHVKSNAIVFVKDQMIKGVGAGQMSRVDSVKIAAYKSGDEVNNGIMASDAFFPFRDSVVEASAAGIAAVIQPGGSKGDADVIAACNELGLVMVFTGIRHFKH